MSYPFKPTQSPKKIREQHPGFETKSDCLREQIYRSTRLKLSDYLFHGALADKLQHCTETNDRCGSAACPRCSRYARGGFIETVVEYSERFDVSKQRIVTVINYSGAMTGKELHGFDPKLLKQRLAKQLKDCGFKNQVIGGLEMDFHEDMCFWLPHFHLLVLDDEEAIEVLRALLKKKEKRSSMMGEEQVISRPLFKQKLNNRAEQISYLFKQQWCSIRSYTDKDGKRKTRKVRLDDSKFRESLEILDRIGFEKLLFRYNLDIRANKLRPRLKVVGK